MMAEKPNLTTGEILRDVATLYGYKPSPEHLERWSRITTEDDALKGWAEMWAHVRDERRVKELEPEEHSYPDTPEGYIEWQEDMRSYGMKQKDKYGVVLGLGTLGFICVLLIFRPNLIFGLLLLVSAVAIAWGWFGYQHGERAHREPDIPNYVPFRGYDPEKGF